MAIWTNDKILKLIERYKESECIWNDKHEKYKCRNSVNKAWFDISEAVEGDVRQVHEMKRKMKNLIGQFYRECRKKRILNKSGTGPEKNSKWFAYNYLLFLQNKKKLRLSTDEGQNEESSDSSWSENENYNNDYEIPEQIETPNFEIVEVKNELLSQEITEQIKEKESTSTSFQEPLNKSSTNLRDKRINTVFRYPKVTHISRRKRNDEEKRKEALRRETYNKEKNKTEWDIFGELVSCKLKNLRTDFARNTVEHIISNVLWEASLGKFDKPQNLSPVNSPSSGSSTSYPNDPLHNTFDHFGYSIFRLGQENKKIDSKNCTSEEKE